LRRKIPMCCFRFTMSASYRKAVECRMQTAQRLGPWRRVKYGLAMLAVVDGQSITQVALVLRVHEKTVATWRRELCCYGLQGAPRPKPTGRSPARPRRRGTAPDARARGARPQRRALGAPGHPAPTESPWGSGIASWRGPRGSRAPWCRSASRIAAIAAAAHGLTCAMGRGRPVPGARYAARRRGRGEVLPPRGIGEASRDLVATLIASL
jgi:hypothetical protein